MRWELKQSFGITVKMFADDVKLYLKIVNNVDFSILQAAMNALCQWAKLWQLSISVDKCCLLSVGKVVPTTDILLNSIALPYVSSCRDLGALLNQICHFQCM